MATVMSRAAGAVIRTMAADFASNPPPTDLDVQDPIQTIQLGLASTLRSEVTSQIAVAATDLMQRTGQPPTPAEWKSLLNVESLQMYVDRAQSSARGSVGDGWPAMRGFEAASARPSSTMTELLSVADFFSWAAVHQPDILNPLFLGMAPSWRTALNFVNPLGLAASSQGGGKVPQGRTPTGILSPVGLINLYREYFVELDTFLGPPVGHVWVSPGGSLELYEVSSRSQTVTQTTEM